MCAKSVLQLFLGQAITLELRSVAGSSTPRNQIKGFANNRGYRTGSTSTTGDSTLSKTHLRATATTIHSSSLPIGITTKDTQVVNGTTNRYRGGGPSSRGSTPSAYTSTQRGSSWNITRAQPFGMDGVDAASSERRNEQEDRGPRKTDYDRDRGTKGRLNRSRQSHEHRGAVSQLPEQIESSTKANPFVNTAQDSPAGVLGTKPGFARSTTEPTPKPRKREYAETWQSQKAALEEKFGSEGWAPKRKLSPDALEGIRALHAQYPEKFTTAVLSDSFKVSPEAIRRILKSKWRPDGKEEEDRRERWERRGQRIWASLVERGEHAPKKWRDLGIGRGPRKGRSEWLKEMAGKDLERGAAAGGEGLVIIHQGRLAEASHDIETSLDPTTVAKRIA